jgi:hypothetical protein
MPQQDNTVLMEGVRIIFRNFIGEAGPYNQAGDINFGVLIDDETAEAMLADDWNVKILEPRPDDEEQHRQAWLPVAIKYEGRNGPVRPPTIFVIKSNGERVYLNEDTIGSLQWADIQNVDVIVRPFAWDYNNKSGVKAYVKTMVVTIQEDYLEQKYGSMEPQVVEHMPEV